MIRYGVTQTSNPENEFSCVGTMAECLAWIGKQPNPDDYFIHVIGTARELELLEVLTSGQSKDYADDLLTIADNRRTQALYRGSRVNLVIMHPETYTDLVKHCRNSPAVFGLVGEITYLYGCKVFVSAQCQKRDFVFAYTENPR